MLPEFAPGDWAVYEAPGFDRFQAVVAKIEGDGEELRVAIEVIAVPYRPGLEGVDIAVPIYSRSVEVLKELREIIDEYDEFLIEPKDVRFGRSTVATARVTGFRGGAEAQWGPYVSNLVPLGLAGMHTAKWEEVKLVDCGWGKDKRPPPYRRGGLAGVGE